MAKATHTLAMLDHIFLSTNDMIHFFCRTTEEIHSGELQWPFWTKLVVVAIGFTGRHFFNGFVLY